MAKKITIQHWYTTGSTAPAASALTLGEIAIATSAGTEAIFIKNNTGGTVDFPTRKQIIDYVDLKTKGIATSGEIELLSNKITDHITGDTATDKDLGHVKLVGGDLDWATGNTITVGEAAASQHTHGQYLKKVSLNLSNGGLKYTNGLNGAPGTYGVKAGTGITVNEDGVSINEEYQNMINSGVSGYTKLVTHEAKTSSTQNSGHVKLVGGDLSGKTGNIVNGEAAASHHTHSQYLTEVVGSSGIVTTGLGVNGIIAVKIDDETRNKINSGVTAFGWGDHASQGYAKNSVLTSHTSNDDIHVSKEEKDSWTNTASSAETWNKTTRQFNAFMSGATTGGTDVIDTLIEIQDFLSGDDGGVKALLDSLSALTTDVENNTTAITKNTNNIIAISGDVKTISGRVDTLSTNVENIFKDFVQTVSFTGSNINVKENGITEKSYEISHTGPSSASTKIEGTTTTGLAFGDSFKVVSNLGYDANGHVVTSATTASTFTLPELPTASVSDAGIVKLMSGDLAMQTTNFKDAAAAGHTHSQYVKFADLSDYDSNTPLIISCGTY